MAKRKFEFVEGEYYHVFNRGVDKRIIFKDKGDLKYFLDSIVIVNDGNTYNRRHIHWRNNAKKRVKQRDKPLVKVIAYAILPNHFHLIITPVVDNGVSKFMQRLGTSHTKFFNEKYERTGALFQGKFKAVQLNNERSLELMGVYVNLNYKYHEVQVEKSISKTSIFEYLKIEKGEGICDSKKVDEIVDSLGGISKYKQYLKRQSEFFANQKGIAVSILNFDELEDK